MLKMRLQRIGRRNDASFRVIVTDSRSGPKSGKNVALLGSYNPKLNRFEIDTEAAKAWIGKGVQVSDTVHNLLISNKVIEGKKRNALPRKSPIVDEAAQKAAEEAKAAEAAAPAEGDTADVSKEASGAAEETEGGAETPTETEEAKPTEATPTEDAPAEEPKPAEEANEDAAEEPKADETAEPAAQPEGEEDPEADNEKKE